VTISEHLASISYHWAGSNGQLIKRWDNTPHHPDLMSFPHHVHDGAAGSVEPGNPTDIFTILDEITARIR